MGTLSRRATLSIVTLILAALFAASCSAVSGGSTYEISAEFPTTVGLFPGSYVRELGIKIGQVTKVVNRDQDVVVTMHIGSKYPLAPEAKAIVVADSLLGERYVQFTPAFLGGARLAAGSVIPPSRTAVPVETDTVLRTFERVLLQVDPKNVKDLVSNLADIVNGQGVKLNQLLANASGTLSVLADKSNDLGQLTGSLATLTGALRTRTDALSQIIRDYDTVSQIIADDRQNVDGTITKLTDATGQAAALLSPNLAGVKDDVSVLTTVGQTLDRNLDSLDIGLANAPKLFTAAKNAYDPAHQWLPLNPQTSASTSSAVIAARIRDSLAGVCRRLAVKNPSLAPSLAACGNPNSGFFDPILNLIPTVISSIPGQTAPAAARAAVPAVTRGATSTTAAPTTAIGAFSLGLSAIPGLTGVQRDALSALAPAAAAARVAAPLGAALDATLDASGSVDPSAMLGPRPALSAAPRSPSLVGRFLSWIGGLW